MVPEVDDMTLAAGLGLSMSQVGLLLLLMAYWPEPTAVVYQTKPFNGTLAAYAPDAVPMSPWYLGAALLTALMGCVTHQLREQQLLDNVIPYAAKSIATVGLWNDLTWAVYALSHVIVVLELASPVEAHCAILLVLLYLFSAANICAPRTGPRPQADALCLVLYLYAAATLFHEMGCQHGAPQAALGIQTALDALLVLGHTYDASCTMLRAGNCRLFYCTAAALMHLMLYTRK